MKSPADSTPTFRVARFEIERTVVWDALVLEMHAWWLRDFMVNPEGVAFRIDPKLGGVMGEDWGDGQGIVWATVVELRRPHRPSDGDARAKLGLSGELMPDFGGPARTQHIFILESTGPSTTRLRFQDCVYGAVSESTAASLKEGWGLILDAFVGYLKA